MAKRVKKYYPPVQKMTPDEQVGMVREVFATIPARYDILNHFFSMRRDVAWRRLTARKMRFSRTNRFLDVATGTTDLAIAAARRHPQIKVVGLDFSREMMAIGRDKIARLGLAERIRLIQGDALNLPFPDHSFDCTGIAFGVRNIPNRRRALEEMQRVTVPGGQVFVLEMNFPRHPLLQPFYNLYLNHVLPFAAHLFSRNPAAYHYLGDSILNFPTPPAFAALMEEAGLVRIERIPLTLGICYLYVGWKPGGDHEA